MEEDLGCGGGHRAEIAFVVRKLVMDDLCKKVMEERRVKTEIDIIIVREFKVGPQDTMSLPC